MSLTAPGLSMQDQRPSFGDEVQPEIGADYGLPQSRLQGEVELVDGLQEGEVRVSSAALQSRLLPSRYFFGQQESQEIPIGPVSLLSPFCYVFIHPAHVRQIQSPKVYFELTLGEPQTLRCVVVPASPAAGKCCRSGFEVLHV